MLLVAAQLRCSVAVTELPADDDALGGAAVTAGATPHVFEFQNALTGEPLSVSEVSALSPRLLDPDGDALPAAGAMEVDASRVRYRHSVSFGAARNYAVRVEGSRRFYGCEDAFRTDGPAARRVVFSLVPRARDIAITVQVDRDGNATGIPDRGAATLEVRADGSSERDVELRRGTCSGERAASGRFWCAEFLSPEAHPVTLAARVEGLGLSRVTLDPNSGERTLAVTAHYDGHLVPTVMLRAFGGIGLVNADGASFSGSVEVLPSYPSTGRACALRSVCVRPLVHVGGAYVPYQRDTVLLGPGTLRTADGSTRGELGVFEVGGGVLVLPPGTGDRFRAMVLASGLLASHGEERNPARPLQLLSAAGTALGLSAELALGFRLFEGFVFQAGMRTTVVPSIGSVGRQFSYLGDASVSSATASLLHLSLQLGLSVEL